MHGEFPRCACRVPAALAVIAAALLAAACSKDEPPSAKARPNAPLETPVAQVVAPVAGDEVDPSLKERLARQDAAARMFERNVLQPPPPKVPEPPKPSAPAPAPSASAPPAVAPAPREAPKPEPVKAATPAKSPAAASPSPPSPAAAKPATAPRTDLAAAKPSAPAPDPGLAKLLSRVDPEFPAEALRAGADRGTVRARMTLDGAGNVTRVEIVEASPRRVFDRAVVRALSQWKFTEGASGRTVEGEVDFRR
jgi:protein TonB